MSTVGLNEATIAKYIREQESHDIAMDKVAEKNTKTLLGLASSTKGSLRASELQAAIGLNVCDSEGFNSRLEKLAL